MRKLAILFLIIASFGSVLSWLQWSYNPTFLDFLPFIIVIQELSQASGWLGILFFILSVNNKEII